MNWLRRVMIGRYGNDQLNTALLIGSVVSMLVERLSGWDPLYFLTLGLLVVCYLRMFSRDVNRRFQENQKFLGWWNPIRARFSGMGASMEDSRTHCHFKCPRCGQKLRVPRGRGKVSVACPRCQNEFEKST